MTAKELSEGVAPLKLYSFERLLLIDPYQFVFLYVPSRWIFTLAKISVW
jgi:hypothetical protein